MSERTTIKGTPVHSSTIIPTIRRSVCALGLLAFCATAHAQFTDLPELVVPKAGESITVDGKLDEAVWKNAARATLSDPWKQTGHPLDPTEVLVVWNETGVYFAFLAEDREILASRVDRDERTHKDDCVEIFIGRNRESLGDALGMEINAIGTVADFYYRHNGWYNHGWQPPTLEIATQNVDTFPLGKTAKGPGFIVEIGLPWAELLYALPEKYNPPKLRVNFARWNWATKGRIFSIWSDPQLEKPGPYRLDRFGTLIFEGAAPTPTPRPTSTPRR